MLLDGALLGPALPGAAEVDVVLLAPVAELDRVADALRGLPAAQRAAARPGHYRRPGVGRLTCIGLNLRCRARGCCRTRRAVVSDGTKHGKVLTHWLALPWMSCTPGGVARSRGRPRRRRGGLSGGGWSRAFIVREGGAGALEVEAKPRLRAVTQAQRAQFSRAQIDPRALDAERARKRRGVDVAPRFAGLLSQQLNHTGRHGVDVVGVKRHKHRGPAARVVGGRSWLTRGL